MIREGGNRELTPALALGTFLDSFRLRCRQSCFSLEKTMFVDRLSEMLPFVALCALGVVNLFAAIGAWRYAQGRRAQRGGRFELLCDQHERPRYCARSAGCC